ncbi:MAG: hypothetical protein ACJA0V_004666, partial [Planctomycetota bacterium]
MLRPCEFRKPFQATQSNAHSTDPLELVQMHTIQMHKIQMHNRQTGAAHVPIMFFLILLVMFLGALGFAYVQQTKNAEVVKAKDAAIAEARVLQQKELLV